MLTIQLTTIIFTKKKITTILIRKLSLIPLAVRMDLLLHSAIQLRMLRILKYCRNWTRLISLAKRNFIIQLYMLVLDIQWMGHICSKLDQILVCFFRVISKFYFHLIKNEFIFFYELLIILIRIILDLNCIQLNIIQLEIQYF